MRLGLPEIIVLLLTIGLFIVIINVIRRIIIGGIERSKWSKRTDRSLSEISESLSEIKEEIKALKQEK